jgi:hypothetical protein
MSLYGKGIDQHSNWFHDYRDKILFSREGDGSGCSVHDSDSNIVEIQ